YAAGSTLPRSIVAGWDAVWLASAWRSASRCRHALSAEMDSAAAASVAATAQRFQPARRERESTRLAVRIAATAWRTASTSDASWAALITGAAGLPLRNWRKTSVGSA